uniref:Sugar phosphate transporter domain-containing protein n=1 Tax=Alexandrium monilatum TaxID=311494 RepID=A0A7S4UGW9_9DINO
MAPATAGSPRGILLAVLSWACVGPAAEAVAAAAAKTAAVGVEAGAGTPTAAAASNATAGAAELPAAAPGSGGRRGRRLKGRREAASLRLAVFDEAAGAFVPEIRAAEAPLPKRLPEGAEHLDRPSAAVVALREFLPAASSQTPAESGSPRARKHWPGLGVPEGGVSFVHDPFNPFSSLNPYAANPFVKNPFTRNPYDNSSQEAREPFVHVRMDWSHNVTHLKVDIATPNIIVSVYLLMFVPIAMAWVAMYHYGFQDRHYKIILAITLCSMIIGQDLVNQSLSALMSSPTAITAIQALAMTIITAVWTLVSETEKPTLSLASAKPLVKWFLVAVLFAVYQLVNHLVSYLCSLSERTVFLNLCPVFTLVFEMTLLPSSLRPKASFIQRMSLCAMVLGAVLFSLQYPDFTPSGILSAVVLVLVLLPYRVIQRWLLVDCMELSVPLLAFYDGLILLFPAWAITYAKQDEFWRTWETWFLNPSITVMLALSWMTFTGAHVCALYMLRLGSATNYLVLNNLSGFIVVFEGIAFFGDKVVQAPLVFAGIAISLCSGLCYAVETHSRTEAPSSSEIVKESETSQP